MNIGLRLDIRSRIASAVPNPSTQSLTGWWRGDGATEYSPSTWTGTASAGSSGSRDLTEATNPPAAGTTQNGHTPADFDGTNDLLANATAISTLLSASAWFAWCLFLADAIDTVLPLSGTFANDALICDSGGFWGFNLGGAGANELHVWQWDGAVKGNAHTVATGSYNLIVARYDGTNIRSKLNSGAISSAAAGNISTTTGTFRAGSNYNGLQFFNGRILEAGLMASAGSDALFDDIKAYINNRYALSL